MKPTQETTVARALTRSQARRLRRKQLRTQHLADIAEANPKLFVKKWNWLLAGWVREVKRRAPQLREEDGTWTPNTAALIADVKDMLENIGDRVVATEMAATLATLNEAQMQALAREVEKHLAPKKWEARIKTKS